MIHEWLFKSLVWRAHARRPDKIIGGEENPYLLRWYLTPFRRWSDSNSFWKIFPNVYLHKFLRSDDDRALHDHPWFNFSFILDGSYIEETIAYGGIVHRVRRNAGQWKIRSPWAAHRVELLKTIQGIDKGGKNEGFYEAEIPCWTIFITGPVLRKWGFHCPRAGWVYWEKFASVEGDVHGIGKGCDQ